MKTKIDFNNRLKKVSGAEKEIHKICNEIIEDIIKPTCYIKQIIFDCYLTTLDLYDSDLVDKMTKKIEKKYKLKKGELEEVESAPLFMISTIVYLKRK